MQIVHLTDLHFRADQPFQKALVEALLKDLESEHGKGLSPDTLVFSGDLVNNPDDPDIYKRFEDEFLLPVLEKLRLTPKDTAFCPGNHDVSRKAVEEWSTERDKLKAAMAGDPLAFSKHMRSGPAQAYARAISAGFFALAEKCGNAWSNPMGHVYTPGSHPFRFVALNTAFGCGLEGSEYDRGKLVVSVEHALGAFQSVPKEATSLSLMHHTTADLNERTHRVLVPIIERQSEAHFYGHVHQARPQVLKSPGSTSFMIQGGALYETNGYYNGYCVIDTGTSSDRVMARYRTYYPDRGEFDEGTNVGTGGVFYSSDAAKVHWEKAAQPASNDDVCFWLMETEEARRKELDKTITQKGLCETFVEPMITRARTADEAATSLQPVTTSQILLSASNTVIACETEYGSTSLLNYLTMRFHSECTSLPKAVVPSYFDSRGIKGSYPAVVTSALRSGLPDSTDPGLKLQPLHDAGRLVVIIDDFDPGNRTQVEFLTAVRKTYPKARLVVAVKMPFVDTQRLKPVIGIEEFDFLQLRTLTRGKIRTLVEKWKLPPAHVTNTVVDEIHTRFTALGIPLSPPYVAIYLSVLQEIDGYNPINSSTVIEQFVESALQKYKPAYAFRSSFDYRNQIDYLGAIAEKMCRKNSFLIPYDELYGWTKTYFDDLGMVHDYAKLIEHFVESKVLAYEANDIYFRYNIFLSFFIAHQMQRSKGFVDWLFTDHRYTNYVAEFDIYCGLSRNDMRVLEFFSTEFEAHAATLEGYMEPLQWVDRLEKLTLPVVKKSDTIEFADRIAKQLMSNMEAAERDEAVSEIMPPEEVKPNLKRPEVIGTLPLWILSLRAYTVALKNLENIPRQEKEKHLRKILHGWSKVMLYSCILFKEMIENRLVEIGPMKFIIDLPEDVDVRSIRLIFLHIPLFISDCVRRDLGSQKLALQLKNDDIPQSLTESFIQTSIYADLKLEGYLGRLRILKDRVVDAGSRSFLEFMLVKLRGIFLRLGLEHDEQDGFLRLAAELSAEVKGLTGEDKLREIEHYTTGLRRAEQVQRLRDNIS